LRLPAQGKIALLVVCDLAEDVLGLVVVSTTGCYLAPDEKRVEFGSPVVSVVS